MSMRNIGIIAGLLVYAGVMVTRWALRGEVPSRAWIAVAAAAALLILGSRRSKQ
jgi:hypothetical protein